MKIKNKEKYPTLVKDFNNFSEIKKAKIIKAIRAVDAVNPDLLTHERLVEIFDNVRRTHSDEPKILKRFYNRLRMALVNAYGHEENEADFETFKWILKNTVNAPSDYLKIFYCIPKESRQRILKHLGYKTATDFKKNFSKQLSIYRQSIFRREEQEDIEEN